jgi:hypothetical protein
MTSGDLDGFPEWTDMGKGTGMASGKTPLTEDPLGLEPTEAELEDWAKRERKRREAWLEGPTAEERAEFARRERERRLAELDDRSAGARAAERARLMRLYPREAQLAAEGAMSLLLRWSRQGFAELVRAGREWEEEFGESARRRRVPLDEDEPAESESPPSSRRISDH